MDTATALNQRDLEDAWSEVGLTCHAQEGELGHWRLDFHDDDGVRVARLLVRHDDSVVEFVHFEVFRPKLRLAGLVSSKLPRFYRPLGFETFRIPRAKGKAAKLFAKIGYEPDGQGGFEAPIAAMARRANHYLAEAGR